MLEFCGAGWWDFVILNTAKIYSGKTPQPTAADRKHRFIRCSATYMVVFHSKDTVNFFGVQYKCHGDCGCGTCWMFCLVAAGRGGCSFGGRRM